MRGSTPRTGEAPVAGASPPGPPPVVLRPGLSVVTAHAVSVELTVPAMPEHAIYVNVGAPYRLVEALDGVVHQTRGVPGDVAVVPAGSVLSARSRDGSPQRVHSLAFVYAADLVTEVLDAAGAPPGEAALAPTLGVRSPQVERLAELVRATLTDRSDLGRLALESLGQAFAVAVVRDHRAGGAAPIESAPRGLSHRQLARVLQHIEDDLAAPLSLADLAAAAHVSPFHFARLFRVSTGTSPHRYVVSRGVVRARELLLHTSVPLPEVAARAGFADQSHLTRLVRQHLGTTPAALRASRSAG